jgi:Na+/proline symporter
VGGVVPLSEHEQRQLEQIEQALYTEDPKFVHAVRSSDPRVHYKRRAVQAVAGFVLGVGLLLGGVITQYIWVGVAGFIVMLVCSMWALTSWRHASGMSAAFGRSRPKTTQRRRRREARARGGPVAGPGLMERLEERWRRRQEGG